MDTKWDTEIRKILDGIISESYTTFKCMVCGVPTDIKDYNGPRVTRIK